ncbi:MAG: hypothetical protein A2167_07160 [Planctomycetes bacterium RBG_13_46_10]|nr:MAG: hypothetical protein A2167_07160 [Planctomycetes bacterium RBG_13_46_10]
MKRYLISAVVVLTVLAVTWAVFGQEAERPREAGRGGFRNIEAQQKAIAAIQEQVAKLKAGLDASAMPAGQSLQDLSEEERTKMREKFMKMREDQQQAIAAIEQQIMILKGRRQLQQEQEASIAELQDIQALAKKENAAETAKRIEDIIAKKNKTFEETMQKLGIPEMRGRPGQGQGQQP